MLKTLKDIFQGIMLQTVIIADGDKLLVLSTFSTIQTVSGQCYFTDAIQCLGFITFWNERCFRTIWKH